MSTSLFNRFEDWSFINPLWLVMTVFQLWMLVHALRNREWIWAIFIFIGFGLAAVLYFFLVYRAAPSATSGFELPGAQSRKRIKELQAQIYHIGNASHHFQLGDVYFQRGQLVEAEKCYRAALELDPKDVDTRAHLGQCLLRQKRFAEARPLLEGVMHEKPEHDYGHTMMALAETLTALGRNRQRAAVLAAHHAEPFLSARQGSDGGAVYRKKSDQSRPHPAQGCFKR